MQEENASFLEQWVRAVLKDDAEKVSIETVRMLQGVRSELIRLQKENENLKNEFEDFKTKVITARICLVEALPVGEVKAWDVIKVVKDHVQNLDNLI